MCPVGSSRRRHSLTVPVPKAAFGQVPGQVARVARVVVEEELRYAKS